MEHTLLIHLRAQQGAPPSLRRLLHVHGLAQSLWSQNWKNVFLHSENRWNSKLQFERWTLSLEKRYNDAWNLPINFSRWFSIVSLFIIWVGIGIWCWALLGTSRKLAFLLEWWLDVAGRPSGHRQLLPFRRHSVCCVSEGCWGKTLRWIQRVVWKSEMGILRLQLAPTDAPFASSMGSSLALLSWEATCVQPLLLTSLTMENWMTDLKLPSEITTRDHNGNKMEETWRKNWLLEY